MGKKVKDIDRFVYFSDRVKKYQSMFGLMDWELFIVCKQMEDNRGTCAYERQSRICTISVDTEFLKSPDTELFDLDKTAFHEICELLLGEIGNYLYSFYSDDYVERSIHKVIRRMENFHFCD